MAAILIAGATGYLGAWLTAQLLEDSDHSVIALARKWPTGWLDGYVKNGRLAVRRWDASEVISSELVQGAQIAVNCVGVPSSECNNNPKHATQVMLLGSLALQEAAFSSGLQKWIQLSTIHVYGPANGTVYEGDACNPQSVYGCLHLAAEKCLEARSTSREKLFVLRLSNAYYPPFHLNSQSWTLAINNFCRQATLHGRIELTSDGSMSRDFIDISSVIAGIRLAIDNEAPWTIANLSSGICRSILSVAHLVAKVASLELGVEVPVFCGSKKESSDGLVCYDSSRLRTLGWRPQVDWYTSIAGCFRACKNALN